MSSTSTLFPEGNDSVILMYVLWGALWLWFVGWVSMWVCKVSSLFSYYYKNHIIQVCFKYVQVSLSNVLSIYRISCFYSNTPVCFSLCITQVFILPLGSLLSMFCWDTSLEEGRYIGSTEENIYLCAVGPLRRSTGIRVASVIEFSVCLFPVCLFSSFFLILLQHNIRRPSRNCIPCAPKFAPGVNLNKHDTSARTNECVNDFLLRVNLRRHIRSRPPKPAPCHLFC